MYNVPCCHIRLALLSKKATPLDLIVPEQRLTSLRLPTSGQNFSYANAFQNDGLIATSMKINENENEKRSPSADDMGRRKNISGTVVTPRVTTGELVKGILMELAEKKRKGERSYIVHFKKYPKQSRCDSLQNVATANLWFSVNITEPRTQS